MYWSLWSCAKEYLSHFHIPPPTPASSPQSSPIQSMRSLPEDSNQRGINGVSIIDVHMVPAALCGKVIETQPQYRIRAGRRGERRQNIGCVGTTEVQHINIYYRYCILHMILSSQLIMKPVVGTLHWLIRWLRKSFWCKVVIKHDVTGVFTGSMQREANYDGVYQFPASEDCFSFNKTTCVQYSETWTLWQVRTRLLTTALHTCIVNWCNLYFVLNTKRTKMRDLVNPCSV